MIAEQVVLACADAATIDRDGLHRTNLRLLAAVLADLIPRPMPAWSTASRWVRVRSPIGPIIGGDRTSAAIAAASVIAKVTRDRAMRALAERYPEYGFDEHMGYATPRHRAVVARCGPSAIHRRSFRSAAYLAYASGEPAAVLTPR